MGNTSLFQINTDETDTKESDKSGVKAKEHKTNELIPPKKHAQITDDSVNRKYDLHIDDDFLKTFDLNYFLKEYVLANSFPPPNQQKFYINIKDYEELRTLILNKWKATEYIGVGVGGVYIRDDITSNSKDEYVLLYKRYHAPEDQLWSIPGGSCAYANKIEDTLKEKFSYITKIDKEYIKVKDIIKANNHKPSNEDQNYHYLSPSYYVDIVNPASKLNWSNNKHQKGKIHVIIIDSLAAFNKIPTSKKDSIRLAWVKVDLITYTAIDKDGKNIFAYTTLEALNDHVNFRTAANQLARQLENANNELNQAKQRICNYKEWRKVN